MTCSASSYIKVKADEEKKSNYKDNHSSTNVVELAQRYFDSSISDKRMKDWWIILATVARSGFDLFLCFSSSIHRQARSDKNSSISPSPLDETTDLRTMLNRLPLIYPIERDCSSIVNEAIFNVSHSILYARAHWANHPWFPLMTFSSPAHPFLFL